MGCKGRVDDSDVKMILDCVNDIKFHFNSTFISPSKGLSRIAPIKEGGVVVVSSDDHFVNFFGEAVEMCQLSLSVIGDSLLLQITSLSLLIGLK